MASRAIDLLITYRIVKLLVKPFDKQEAFKYGIIDKDGNVLEQEPFMTCFGIDIYEKDGELYSEDQYENL